MGLSYYENNVVARSVFESLEKLQPGLLELIFKGEPAELSKTINTQPALFAVELAIFAALSDSGFKPSALCGFSLGEISALTASGALSLEEGFKLVNKRAEIMQRAADAQETRMLVSLKLVPEQVESVCAQFEGAYPVNYNSPLQTVVACRAETLEELKSALAEAGGRSMVLPVNAGFHSPFMDDASAEFARVLESFAFGSPCADLYSNKTAKPYEGDFRALLSSQINHPVRWNQQVLNLKARGFTNFIEVGPSKVLCGLIGKIDPELECVSLDSYEHFLALQEVSHA